MNAGDCVELSNATFRGIEGTKRTEGVELTIIDTDDSTSISIQLNFEEYGKLVACKTAVGIVKYVKECKHERPEGK